MGTRRQDCCVSTALRRVQRCLPHPSSSPSTAQPRPLPIADAVSIPAAQRAAGEGRRRQRTAAREVAQHVEGWHSLTRGRRVVQHGGKRGYQHTTSPRQHYRLVATYSRQTTQCRKWADIPKLACAVPIVLFALRLMRALMAAAWADCDVAVVARTQSCGSAPSDRIAS